VTQTFTVTPTCTATPLPLTIADQGPFPNPFRDDTNIVYWISADADVDVKIYTVSGEVVYWEEDPERKLKGYNKFYWNGKNKGLRKVASGVYIYRISAVSDRGEHVRVFGKTACVR
jgi:flagellar hook assembly protein FlgD